MYYHLGWMRNHLYLLTFNCSDTNSQKKLFLLIILMRTPDFVFFGIAVSSFITLLVRPPLSIQHTCIGIKAWFQLHFYTPFCTHLLYWGYAWYPSVLCIDCIILGMEWLVMVPGKWTRWRCEGRYRQKDVVPVPGRWQIPGIITRLPLWFNCRYNRFIGQ
jgi:hypothetical protein